MMITEESLVPVGDEQYVFRVADGKVERVKVRTGLRRAGKVEIREGLAAGDTIVTAGQIKLRDGVPVRAVGAPAPDATLASPQRPAPESPAAAATSSVHAPASAAANETARGGSPRDAARPTSPTAAKTGG
jgi:membrane fusion protein (multidrug efflux system)